MGTYFYFLISPQGIKSLLTHSVSLMSSGVIGYIGYFTHTHTYIQVGGE